MSVIPRLKRIAAKLARTDFHDFVEFVGADDDGAPLVQRPMDKMMWEFVEQCHDDGVHAGVMLPMGFGKTTQFCYRAGWEIGRDPNALVSVVTDSAENSKERVALIRQILNRPEYRMVFPHIVVIEGHDERSRFTVERDGMSKDPTCSSSGVLTGTGTRTNFLLMDDVVTQRNAILEPTNRKRVHDAIRLTWISRTKVHSLKKTRVAWINTAYHQADASAVLRTDPESGWRWLVVRAEAPYEELGWERWECGEIVETGTVECPYPPEAVAERARRMGPTAAARGLANKPVSDSECPFKEDHFKAQPPGHTDEYGARYMFADPAGDATKVKTGDPDYCAVVVIGRRFGDTGWDVLCAERMRGAPSAQARFIARKAVQFGVRTIYQEAVKDEALVEVTENELRALDVSIPVRPEKPTTNKQIRIIQTLEPALACDPPQLRVCGNQFPELRDEALTFPAAAHDDLLDALAGVFAQVGSMVLRPVGTVSNEPVESHIKRGLRGIRPEGENPFRAMRG